jgi:hypothetical protein
MNIESKKTCPLCAEEIPLRAKLCPRCRQWLSLRSFRHPLVATAVAGLPMVAILVLVAVGFTSAFERLGNPGPHYAEFAHPIKIVESRMNWVETSSGLRLYVTGLLTNQSEQAWKEIEFDCRFFDPTGVMIDAANGRAYLTVLPADNSAFRTSIVPTRATNEYASFKISVNNARNAKAWF